MIDFLRAFIAVCSAGIIFAFVKLIRDWRKLRSLNAELSVICSQEVSEAPGEEVMRLTLQNWSDFERNIHNLKQVIVVADAVQEPHDSLRDAVIHNFSRGVRYSFIVSRSKALAERHGYLKMFEGLATIAIAKHQLKLNVSDLVSIQSFDDEWRCVPFVFYRVEDTDAPLSAATRFRTLAFWGDKWFAGIANNYQSLPAAVADGFATALMAGAPQPIKAELEKLEQDKFSGAEEVIQGNNGPRLHVVHGNEI